MVSEETGKRKKKLRHVETRRRKKGKTKQTRKF